MGVNYAVWLHSPVLAEEMPRTCPLRDGLKGLGETHSWFLENLPGLPIRDSGEAGVIY